MMGWVKVHREIMQSEIWVNKPAWWLKVWIYIILQVNHADNRYFNRGENFFTYDKIHSDCHLAKHGTSAEATQNLIRWLRKTGMITTRKTTRGLHIKIVKYEVFQGNDISKNDTGNDTENDTKNVTETTQKPHYKQELKELKEVTTAKPLEVSPTPQTPNQTTNQPLNHFFKRFKATMGVDPIRDYGMCKKIIAQIEGCGVKFDMQSVNDFFNWYKDNPWWNENNKEPNILLMRCNLEKIAEWKRNQPAKGTDR